MLTAVDINEISDSMKNKVLRNAHQFLKSAHKRLSGIGHQRINIEDFLITKRNVIEVTRIMIMKNCSSLGKYTAVKNDP